VLQVVEDEGELRGWESEVEPMLNEPEGELGDAGVRDGIRNWLISAA
jgi:hypothetical protein